jgi:DNA polymerase-3 subunit alpha/error-prone DNA polymerase
VRSPADVAERAAASGAKSLAVCDRDNLYGVHAALEETKARGLKPVVGCELTDPAGSVFAFVRDRRGFSRLCGLLTEKKKGSLDLFAALAADSAGLVLASARSGALRALYGKVPILYAAVTPDSAAAVRDAARLGLPPAALDDATFLDTDDRAVHAVLRAVALGKTVGTLGEADAAAPDAERFRSPAELERVYSSWPEAVRGADGIASLCAFDTVFDGFVFPGYDADGKGDAAAALRERVLEGAERRYGELSEAVMERIDYELSIISAKGFAPYFLVMDDIVAMASRTCGRGSGAASVVSYALDITNVDPIAHRLYFERFLNLARPDPPDIDVDFAWDERDELIRRVIDRFGPDRCARVANHNMFRPRSALRETAKAYGLSEGEISRVERSLLQLGEGSDALDPLWTEVLAIAARLEGLPRGLSMHCGGLVIAPGPIARYAPVERSADGFPLLAWEKEGAEAAGLVKIDLLGNRSLAVIRDALANLEEEGVRLDQRLWRPAEDEATVAALARGDSLGVFYIESPAMRQLQKKTGRGDFEHIVIHSSIIRPAANKFIAEYVRRLKGGGWKPLHPRLAYILDETYGILCYQEDVSKTAVALAGFSDVDADRLRKVIAKKAAGAKLAEYEERFFAGCRANGVEEETIREVWAMMLSFDGYSFCKPHSASYAMVSFQSAYLRVHHPAQFMAAVLTNQGGYYRPQAYISEARRMGLGIAGPDANRSSIPYRGEGRTVVVGLMAVAKLSRSCAEALIAERRRGGAFRSLADVSARLRLGRDDAVSLVAAGAFDSVSGGESRAAQARSLLSSLPDPAEFRRNQIELFAPRPRARPSRAAQPPAVPSRRTEEELRNEFEALGYLRDRHPLSLWAGRLAAIGRVRAVDLPRCVGQKVGLVGWPVTQKEVWTVDGSTMDFLSLEDETALYETVLFPDVYARFRTLLFDQRPLRVWGAVKDDQGAINVEIIEVRPL